MNTISDSSSKIVDFWENKGATLVRDFAFQEVDLDDYNLVFTITGYGTITLNDLTNEGFSIAHPTASLPRETTYTLTAANKTTAVVDVWLTGKIKLT